MIQHDYPFEINASKWREHPFYAPDTLVLGIDIGIEGIGITLRRGADFLYSKTLLSSLPQSQSLATRRENRAQRRTRKNRRLRLHRLKQLFRAHDLPWVDDDVMSRSDPFLLRHRGITQQLASPHALSIAIRSIVQRRGFDYYAMSSEGEGQWPWGESSNIADARKWVSSSYISAELRDILTEQSHRLHGKNDQPLSDEDLRDWYTYLDARHEESQHQSIEQMLHQYKSTPAAQRKARGFNYPRNHVAAHLRTLLERHRHLIPRYDEFVATLLSPCKTPAEKKIAIFHYLRKTPDEARAHFLKKVKQCPYTAILDLAPEPCSDNSELAIKRWKLLDLLSNRRFDFVQHGRCHLPEQGVRVLYEGLAQDNATWSSLKSQLEQAIKPYKIANKNESSSNPLLLEQLSDICAPRGSKSRAKASMCASSARLLISLATQDETCFAPQQIEEWKKHYQLYTKRDQISDLGGIFPQVRELLGTLRVRPRAHASTPFATVGLLQRLFERDLSDVLGGARVPDYCIIECIKNAAVNSDQAKEIQKEQQDRRKSKEKLAKKYNRQLADLSRSDIYRLYLFEEQGGSTKTPARCPFTAEPLGCDPFASDLELAHLYPDSRGGLFVAENLVLTRRTINEDMENRTPYEAAHAGIAGWLSWEQMQEHSKNFRWGERKKYFFRFIATPEERFPDFNNMTRISQLARELRKLCAHWMGIAGDREAIRTRIGNPCGTYTAAARHSILPSYKKDRSNHLHHRIDAAILSLIPPADGLNDTRYGGIFYSTRIQSADGKQHRRLRCLVPYEQLAERPPFTASDESCPVIKIRSKSKHKSLGDSTFWSVDEQGMTSQRAPLTPEGKSYVNGKLSRQKDILEALQKNHTREQHMPSLKTIEDWITSSQPATSDEHIESKPLCKGKHAMPIKKTRKHGGKGHLNNSPLGWSGLIEHAGDPTRERFSQMRALDAKNDRLELWIGWNQKKQAWEYYTRVIPDKQCLYALKRLGMPWRGRKNAPLALQRFLDGENKKRKTYPDLKTAICGTLPPHATHLTSFRKGDTFELPFKNSVTKDQHAEEENSLQTASWGEITALKSTGSLEFKSLFSKLHKPLEISTPKRLANLRGYPEDAQQLAHSMQLVPPL